MWGILPKGMSELKKRGLNDDVENITRSGKQYKPSFSKKDHPGRNMEEGLKPIKLKGKEEKEEEDRVLIQLKKTQAPVSIWGLLMASCKHRSIFLNASNGREVPIETIPQEVLSLMGVESLSHPTLPFLMNNSLLKE